MTTVRLQIMDALADLLGTATGLNVHRNLDYALDAGGLPALAVVSGPDGPQDESGSPISKLDHLAQVEISILVSRSANPEAAADPHEATIHAALSNVSTLGGQSVYVSRSDADWDFDMGDTCRRMLRYQVQFRTDRNNLQTGGA